MKKLAKKGETILYIGEIENAFDSTTRRLMRKYLIIGKWYKVERVTESNPLHICVTNKTGYTGRGHMCYLIDGFWYPCKSFVKNYGSYHLYIGCRYNLK